MTYNKRTIVRILRDALSLAAAAGKLDFKNRSFLCCRSHRFRGEAICWVMNRRQAMTTIALKLTRNLSGWRHRESGADLKSLSDEALQDIGFKLTRRDLDVMKPFWMA